MLPEPGALFDRYRIEAVLGEGGMGRAYRAFDERLHRRVALKILHLSAGEGSSDSRGNTAGAARLLREARAAAALDHPNAVAIFDVGEARVEGDPTPMPYIAMELIVGRTLRAFIGVAEVSVAERVRWLTDVARALAAAHKSGLVHRDVKPENVMVRDDGVVKVLDFGIARRSPVGKVDPGAATQAAEIAGTLTADGIVVGTPFYMAPEQMRGEPLSGAADQFSWGVMAYELLSGALPWDRAGDSLKIISQVLSMEPPSLRSAAPLVSPVIDSIVSRAMAKAPQDRFPSMDALVSSLDANGPRPTSPPPPVSAIETFGFAPTVQSTKTSLATGANVLPSSPRLELPKRRLPTVVLGLVAVAGLGAAALAVGMHARKPSPATADAAPGPVGLTDLPLPKTSPEALVAYQEGMRALRRGDLASLSPAFKRAVDLDPQLAPALLRLGFGLFLHRPTQAREYFRRASELRSTLTERDQQLLDAYAPFVQKDPSDLPETRARLAAMAARYPMDAEVSFELGSTDRRLFHFEVAIPEYERALQLDPGYGYAAQGKSSCYYTIGKTDEAIQASKECERASPGVLHCLDTRIQAEERDGHCAELLEDSRRMIVAHPDSRDGYLVGAQALYALGRPLSAVRESVVQARARAENGSWPRESTNVEINLEVLQGNFAQAEKVAVEREASPAFAASSDEGLHAIGTWARVEVALETGQMAKAADLIVDYRARSQAWSPTVAVSAEPEFDVSLMMGAVLEHAKRITAAQFEEERTAKIAGTDTKTDPLGRGYVWFTNYARVVATPEEAKAALAVLPQYQPIPSIWSFPAEFAIGEVYRLAGRIDEAIPLLKLAAAECSSINFPFEITRAHYALGQALETKKDTAGACAAYGVVLDRWGQAKPRSLTADAARARSRALGCP